MFNQTKLLRVPSLIGFTTLSIDSHLELRLQPL